MNYYFHFPFCQKKCGYCAFYSEPAPSLGMIDAYLRRLELELEASTFPVAETIYLGGGTPTLPDPARLERFFNIIRKAIPIASKAEITIEANPETLTVAKIALIRSFATRISLGVQSFSAKHRRTLGRDCSDLKLKNAIKLIQDAKFPEWNIDLIYAIPGASREDFFKDLDTVMDTGATHLSCYSLTPEEGARLGKTLQPDEEQATDLWKAIPKRIATKGFKRYEISNYAVPGHECRHNVAVWRGGLLAGFGPASASFDGKKRYTQVSSLADWITKSAPEVDEIPLANRLNEIFAVNLRTTAGWTPTRWNQVPGADPWENRLHLARQVAQATSTKFFKISPKHLALTNSGLLFWNSIAEELL